MTEKNYKKLLLETLELVKPLITMLEEENFDMSDMENDLNSIFSDYSKDDNNGLANFLHQARTETEKDIEAELLEFTESYLLYKVKGTVIAEGGFFVRVNIENSKYLGIILGEIFFSKKKENPDWIKLSVGIVRDFIIEKARKDFEDSLKHFTVQVPITGYTNTVVKAVDREDAIVKACSQAIFEEIEEWNVHKTVAVGNVCYALLDEATVVSED